MPTRNVRRPYTRLVKELGKTAVFFVVGDVCIGFLLGSCLWLLGWDRPPIKDFFVALAGIGPALLIAFSVTVTQLLPVFVRSTLNDLDRKVTPGDFGAFFGAVVGLALASLVGISACLALIDGPLTTSHWWLMGLFGVAMFTIGVLSVVIVIGTLAYVLLEFSGTDDP